jgi:GH24 family phage-related lysozyme (muramidase)
LLSKLNAGDYAGARDQFAAWSKITINGIKQTSSGLLARRNDEAQQFA